MRQGPHQPLTDLSYLTHVRCGRCIHLNVRAGDWAFGILKSPQHSTIIHSPGSQMGSYAFVSISRICISKASIGSRTAHLQIFLCISEDSSLKLAEIFSGRNSVTVLNLYWSIPEDFARSFQFDAERVKPC